MKLRRFLFAFLLSLAAVQFCFSQENEPHETWNNGVFHSRWEFGGIQKDKIAEIKKRWQEIGDSLKTTSNPFAGTYYQSGNRGYYLRWSPENGFVYVYYYEYFVIDASYGKVSATDSDIVFIPEREMENGDAGTKLVTPTNWIPALTGKYLVRKEAATSFGNFYGGYKEFNGFPRNFNCDCSPFAERLEKTSSQNLSILPAKYRRFLKKPINGKIISIGQRVISLTDKSVPEMGKTSSTAVTINIGRKNGVTHGMMFLILDGGDDYWQVLKVKKVGSKTSQAIVSRSADDKGNEVFYDGWENNLKKEIYRPFSKLHIGTKITTSPVLAEIDLN